MILEIITPEETIISTEVNSVQFPGADGSFQVLNNHAAIVSALVKGNVKMELTSSYKQMEELHGGLDQDKSNDHVLHYGINGGVMEMSNNKIIVLADEASFDQTYKRRL